MDLLLETFEKGSILFIPRKATNCSFSMTLNIDICVVQARTIASYNELLRLALDTPCSPKKAQFITFRGIGARKDEIGQISTDFEMKSFAKVSMSLSNIISRTS